MNNSKYILICIGMIQYKLQVVSYCFWIFFQRKTQIGSRRMSNFSDKEDRMLIQLAHRQNVAKGKRISWSNIATKMRTKNNPG